MKGTPCWQNGQVHSMGKGVAPFQASIFRRRSVALAPHQLTQAAVPHPRFGEAVTTVVVPSDDPIKSSRPRTICSRAWQKFKPPKRVFFRDRLPKEHNRKGDQEFVVGTYEGIFGPAGMTWVARRRLWLESTLVDNDL